MTDEYSRSVLKVVVAQICQTIGYSSVNSTPYEFLVDLMEEYMLRIARLTHQYSETLGRTTPNLDDLGLAFKHMNIDINELADYIENVDSVPCVKIPPKFPARKESHLNFLKPGSDEVVTRPVHVHEHLPAMYPETEGEVKPTEIVEEKNGIPTEFCNGPSGASNDVSPSRNSSQVIFKRPGEPASLESPLTKRARLMEEGRPLREIHSVMMTTSGFLSPAREGKLPEARTPQQTRSDSPPPPLSYPMVPPELKSEKKPKKILKTPEGRKLDKENKKKNRKELFKVEKVEGKKKVKEGKSKKCKAIVPGPSGSAPVPKMPKASGPKIPKLSQKVKLEKSAELAVSLPSSVEVKEETVDKLPSEPDKQKLNIFKKISKPREDKEKEMADVHKYGKDGLPFAADSPKPVDERLHEVDEKVEDRKPFTPEIHIPGEDVPEVLQQPYGFNNNSPLSTPVPKTPELDMYLMSDQKKKRKDKISKKKESKSKTPKEPGSKKVKQVPMEIPEVELLDRPKTPQAPEPPLVREPVLPPTLPFPFFQNFTASPNFIPNPLFSRFPMPLGRGMPMPPHGLPIPPRFPGGPLAPPMRPEDFSMNRMKPEREKHLPIPPPLNDPEPFVKEKEKVEKVKPIKYEKETRPITPPAPIVPVMAPFTPAPEPVLPPAPVSSVHTPIGAPPSPIKSTKLEKEKEKKIKEHKKEKKDKTKKKKDKKDKHKEKGLKIKEKKDKSDKKDKLEKIKEKKDKKEKRKEKEAKQKAVKEEKAPESVPKLTFKLGPPSPRPATPDNPLMKKITIKPVTKKPEEEVKRELSPELAKISALVTRPPKPKSTSKKAEEGLIDMNPAFATDNSFSTNLTSVSTATVPRAQKTVFKALPPREPEPPVSQYQPYIPITNTPEPYYFDPAGRQIWICPACGRPDDGSPMVGCDDCDAWYHWVCVGMQVPPAENENWYCRICIAKKEEQHHDKKKKKRKKKMKVPA